MKRALGEPPTSAEVLALLETAAGQRQRQLDNFRGQKTHEKTFLGFLDKLPLGEFNEAELEKLCGYLKTLDARRPWQKCLDTGERHFPDNPAFLLSRLDWYLSNRTPDSRPWLLTQTLASAHRLVQQLPRKAQERYLPLLRQRQQQVEAISGSRFNPMEILGNMFERFGGPDDFDDEDDW